MDWQVGQKVYWNEQYSKNVKIAEIERLTKTRIILKNNHTKFRISDGFMIGSNSWHNPFLRLLTPEVEQEQKERDERTKYLSLLNGYSFGKIQDITKLKTIYEILKEQTK